MDSFTNIAHKLHYSFSFFSAESSKAAMPAKIAPLIKGRTNGAGNYSTGVSIARLTW